MTVRVGNDGTLRAPSAVPSPAAFAASSPLVGRGGIRRLRADDMRRNTAPRLVPRLVGRGGIRRLRAEWIPAYAGMTVMGSMGRDGAHRARLQYIPRRLIIPAKAATPPYPPPASPPTFTPTSTPSCVHHVPGVQRECLVLASEGSCLVAPAGSVCVGVWRWGWHGVNTHIGREGKCVDMSGCVSSLLLCTLCNEETLS